MPATLGEAFKEPRYLDFSSYTRSTDLSSLQNHSETLAPQANLCGATAPHQGGSSLNQLVATDEVSAGHVSEVDIDAEPPCEQHISHILSCAKCRKKMKLLIDTSEDDVHEGFVSNIGNDFFRMITDRDLLVYVAYGIAIILLINYLRT